MSASRSKRNPKKVRRYWANKVKQYKKEVVENREIIPTPPEMEKMSEVLLRFVEPYARYAKTPEDYEKLYSIAAIAWNAALISEEQPYLVDNLIDEHFLQDRNKAKMVINELVARKKQYFSQYLRMIVQHDLKRDGNQMHVSVLSVPIDKAEKGADT